MKIGPIPKGFGSGKEVITQLTTNMLTNKEFYTDSNGRDFLKRVSLSNFLKYCSIPEVKKKNAKLTLIKIIQVRDYREDWPLKVNEPVAGNYYPVNFFAQFLREFQFFEAKKEQLSSTFLTYYSPIQLNLGIYIKDNKSELSILVDRATGGGSIKDGQVELLLHRYNTKLRDIFTLYTK